MADRFEGGRRTVADTHAGIANYLRERREVAGLSRAELGRRAGVSEALIQKIEQGTRTPTATALAALYEALDVPHQYREHAAAVLQPGLAGLAAYHEAPEPAELAFLHGLPNPACYQTVPALDVIAANEAYLRWFPGLVVGGNVIEWMLFDPRSRDAISEWDYTAHIMVHGFRYMAAGNTAPERAAEIVATCGQSPDWDRFWHTDIAPADIPRKPTAMRSPDTGDWVPMYIQLFRYEMPRRPWWMYSVVPIP